MFFCDVFKTSQIHLKKDVFYVTSLRLLEQYLKKDVFSVTSLRRLRNIILQVFLVFRKYPTKIISCHFCKVITISDKIDMEPLETLMK